MSERASNVTTPIVPKFGAPDVRQVGTIPVTQWIANAVAFILTRLVRETDLDQSGLLYEEARKSKEIPPRPGSNSGPTYAKPPPPPNPPIFEGGLSETLRKRFQQREFEASKTRAADHLRECYEERRMQEPDLAWLQNIHSVEDMAVHVDNLQTNIKSLVAQLYGDPNASPTMDEVAALPLAGYATMQDVEAEAERIGKLFTAVDMGVPGADKTVCPHGCEWKSGKLDCMQCYTDMRAAESRWEVPANSPFACDPIPALVVEAWGQYRDGAITLTALWKRLLEIDDCDDEDKYERLEVVQDGDAEWCGQVPTAVRAYRDGKLTLPQLIVRLHEINREFITYADQSPLDALRLDKPEQGGQCRRKADGTIELGPRPVAKAIEEYARNLITMRQLHQRIRAIEEGSDGGAEDSVDTAPKVCTHRYVPRNDGWCAGCEAFVDTYDRIDDDERRGAIDEEEALDRKLALRGREAAAKGQNKPQNSVDTAPNKANPEDTSQFCQHGHGWAYECSACGRMSMDQVPTPMGGHPNQYVKLQDYQRARRNAVDRTMGVSMGLASCNWEDCPHGNAYDRACGLCGRNGARDEGKPQDKP